MEIRLFCFRGPGTDPAYCTREEIYVRIELHSQRAAISSLVRHEFFIRKISKTISSFSSANLFSYEGKPEKKR